MLQNFDKRLIKPIGSFRCFLRWKDHKYRVKFEVMGIETPNLLSRETTFLMGILKKCPSVEKTQNEPNDQISSLPVSGHSVPPTEADPLASTEGVFSHSVPPTEADPLASTEGVIWPFSSAHGREISNELCQHLQIRQILQTPPQIVL